MLTYRPLSDVRSSEMWFDSPTRPLLRHDTAAQTMSKEKKAALKNAVTVLDSSFWVPRESSDVAWGSATEWMTTAPGLRLDIVTDTVLETHRSFRAERGALVR